MTTYTQADWLGDFTLTEREYDDSDVEVLRQELADADAQEQAYEEYLMEQAERDLPPQFHF